MDKRVLNSNHLKIIAILAMTIDHFTDLFYPNFPAEPLPILLHIIGRITAPIMWFFICEGFYYTKNIKKYMLRLGIFAVISHFAYCFGFGIELNPLKGSIFNRTSVMYPLFIASFVYSIPGYKKYLDYLRDPKKIEIDWFKGKLRDRLYEFLGIDSGSKTQKQVRLGEPRSDVIEPLFLDEDSLTQNGNRNSGNSFYPESLLSGKSFGL